MNQWSKPFQGNQADCGAHIPSFGFDWWGPTSGYGHEWLAYCRAELVLYNVYQYGVPGDAALDLTYNQFQQALQQVASILTNEQVYNFQDKHQQRQQHPGIPGPGASLRRICSH